jgi:hypothetical protein
MKTFVRSCLVLAVGVVLAGPSWAEDVKKADEKKADVQKAVEKKVEKNVDANKAAAKGKKPAAAGLFNLPKEVQLSDDQQAKVKELIAKFNPRMAELHAKQQAIITPEQAKAREEAVRKAKEEGKTGKDAKQAIEATLQISAEQKQQLSELKQAQQALQKEARDALMSLLTDEQKAQLPKKGAKQPKGDAPKQPKGEPKKQAVKTVKE